MSFLMLGWAASAAVADSVASAACSLPRLCGEGGGATAPVTRLAPPEVMDHSRHTAAQHLQLTLAGSVLPSAKVKLPVNLPDYRDPDVKAGMAAIQAARNNSPLTDADKELLTKVRLAGLWEMPAGQLATTKGKSRQVRAIGAMISQQHSNLDAMVVKAAAKVGLALPSEPNSDQQGWLAEMNQATGTDFDQIFVDRLRAAHGKVFPVIAQVRSGTRNSVVRALAQSANNFVLGHLTMLESTSLVDFTTLPLPAVSPAVGNTAATTGSGGTPAIPASAIWVVLSGATVAGAVGAYRLAVVR